MKRRELIQDIATARQTLLESLVSMSNVILDGSRDDDDGKDLGVALDQIRSAKDTVDLVYKRLQFLQKLERLRSGSVTASGRWHTVSLVRLGVDCGYPIDDVNRIVEAALGVVIKHAGVSAGTPTGVNANAGQMAESINTQPQQPGADPPNQCVP